MPTPFHGLEWRGHLGKKESLFTMMERELVCATSLFIGGGDNAEIFWNMHGWLMVQSLMVGVSCWQRIGIDPLNTLWIVDEPLYGGSIPNLFKVADA